MTTTHARTANEQRIASLECQVVVMREALRSIYDDLGKSPMCQPVCNARETVRSTCLASSDYANKVVVDWEEWDAANKVVEVLTERNTRMSTGYKDWQGNVSGAIDEAINDLWIIRSRLDSLRKQGGGE